MKWLFYLAIVLNIAFLGYNLIFNKTLILPQETLVQSVSAGKTLVLLNEVNNAGTEGLESPTKESAVSDKQNVHGSVLDKITQVDTGVHDTSQYITSFEIIQPDIHQSAKNKDDNIPQLTKQESTEPQKQSTLASTKSSLTDIASVCFNLGPFKKQQLDKIKYELEQRYSNNISFGIETTSKITYYRIYIPPLKTRELRKQALSHLDQNGMTDHYVMSIDGRKNAIALGVFKKRSAAEKVAARANKLGFSTTIEAISDDKNSLYNLQLVLQAGEELAPLNKVITEKKLKLTECNK